MSKKCITLFKSFVMGIAVVMALLCHVTPTFAQETIKIGANYELSGSAASYGQQMLEGLQMAVDEVNRAGGLLDGQQVEIVSFDNKSEVTEAASVAQRLVSEEVVGVVGPSLTSTTQAQIPILQETGIPSVSPSATDDNIVFDEGGNVLEYFYRVCFSNSYQGRIGAAFVANQLKATKAVVLTDQAADYSQGLADEFKAEFVDHGGAIVFESAFQSGDTDFSALLTSLIGQDFDVIYLPAYYNEAGLLIKQARELGITQPIMGPDGFSSPVLAELAGNTATDIYFTDHFSQASESERVQSFLKVYQDTFGKEAGTWQALGYDAAMLIFDAIQRANSTDTEAINQALADTQSFEGVTGKFSIDENHNPVKPAVVIEMQDGEIVGAQEVGLDN